VEEKLSSVCLFNKEVLKDL